MKVAIIGAHSTGKTTLLHHLSRHLTELGHTTSILPEYARLCPFPINVEATIDTQLWIQEQQINQESAIDHSDNFLLCDRATIDNFAYLLRIARQKNLSEHILAWEERAARHMSTYDVIFKTTKLPIDAVRDGKRSTDEGFRNDIDILIHELLRKHKIPYIPLPQTANYATHLPYMLDKLALAPIPSLVSHP
jgi:nicotinamide riboside kinase